MKKLKKDIKIMNKLNKEIRVLRALYVNNEDLRKLIINKRQAAYKRTTKGRALANYNQARKRYRDYNNDKNIDVTTYEKNEMVALYVEAARLSDESGVSFEVDHIIPLCEKGQHRFNNLQILTATENKKKGGYYNDKK